MGSLSFSEIMTILVIILIVFGPDRLPDLARRVGTLIARSRTILRDFTDTMQAEFGDAGAPLKEVADEIGGARRDITDAIASVTGNEAEADDGTDQPDGDARITDITAGDHFASDGSPDAVRRFRELRKAELDDDVSTEGESIPDDGESGSASA